MKIAIFSGGRGCASIIKSLFIQTDSEITILVNAYDNGKSTGRIREFIPGMLGPSDIRKNFSTILECHGLNYLSEFLEHRLSSNMGGSNTIDFIRSSTPEMFSKLSYSQYEAMLTALNKFDNYSREKREKFDTADCAIGNLIFAGIYLENNCNFNVAVQKYQKIFANDNSRLQILNVTDGENLFLIAKSESGKIFFDEEEIVSNVEAESIREIGLTPDVGSQFVEAIFFKPYRPKPNPEAVTKLSEADIIIYGPGTQASSLLPSYLTTDLLEAISLNSIALKVFISNLVPDFDDPSSDIASRLNTFYKLASRVLNLQSVDILITNVFSELPVDANLSEFLTFDANQIIFQTDDWLIEANRHLGPAIVRQLGVASEGKLESRPGFVSLIVSQTFSQEDYWILEKELREPQLGLDFEVIILRDRKRQQDFPWKMPTKSTQEIRCASNVEEALGLARGDLLAYIEDCRLYSIRDLIRGISLMRSESVQLVLGSRNLKILDLKAQIHEAYPAQKIRGFISYWGSLSISISFLLRHRRFISDPLSGIKVFQRSALAEDCQGHVAEDFNINLIKYFIKMDFPIQQIEVGYDAAYLDNSNRHNFKDGLLSLVRIWRP